MKGSNRNSGSYERPDRQPQRSGRGRRRGEEKNEEELERELQAKGRLHYQWDKIPPDLSVEQQKVQQERGLQKGFGKNQLKEGVDRKTRYGTRAAGGDHG